jgi:UDP-N-acetylglucosamine 2-epimerase
MGEIPEHIWVTGGTGLDRLRSEPELADQDLSGAFGISMAQPFFMIIHHPTPMLNPGAGGAEMEEVLAGVLALGYPAFCSYPNYDPGNMVIRKAIDEARINFSNLIVYHNLRRDYFVNLFRRCAAMVGNSSAIVLEASYLHVPGILVGPRQDLRERGPNVLRVEPRRREIYAACERALKDDEFRREVQTCSSLYGDGFAAPRIARILGEVELLPAMLCKTITY